MAEYDASRIRKPAYFRVGPLRRGRPNRPTYIIGFDSEAEHGRPFMFQFAHPDGHVDLLDVAKDKRAGFERFLYYLADRCTRKDVEYIIFGWNLQYEYTQLFRALPPDALTQSEFTIQAATDDGDKTFIIRAMNDKRFAFTVEIGGTKRRVRIIDGMAFIPASLNEAGKIIGVGAKLAKPESFSRKVAHTPAFQAYARQDAILTQQLGEYIMGLHEQYDVATCVSAPHFAARTFRRHYLHADLEPLQLDLEQLGLDSYHGGKNGYYDDRPRLYRKVFNYDIRSAYPEAMAQLPNIETGEWSFAETYQSGSHSLWRATIVYSGCKYEPLYHIDNSRATKSNVPQTLALTGYELDSAIACGCVTLIHAEGFIFEGERGGPLFDYCQDFFSMKRNAATSAERTTAKLFLNSLYGKFFQKVALGDVGVWELGIDGQESRYIATDPTQEFDYEAGGLYHPPLASLITGFVRAKIHHLEHKYGAIMTSTDGFFAEREPDAADLGDELGALDCQPGELRIWRERLYIFRAVGGKLKYALHGFRGKVEDLRKVPLRAGIEWHYQAVQMITNRMSLRNFRGERHEPGVFVTMEFVLALAVPP